ncbi:MAG: nucleotide exchange factor GrpE [Legionella longbeachae]|nr:nucleotide exchange factor GrpE [Legionella longbeachae]
MSKHGKKDWQQFREEHHSQEPKDIENSDESIDAIEDESIQETSEAALDHPSYVALSEKLTLAEQQAHENWEKSVRALAELDNVRRRAEREVANAHRYGVEKLLTGLLPVIDSLEQALQLAIKSEDLAMREGLELTLKLFVDALQKYDVQQIDPMGLPFDPQQHEAMSMQDAPGVEPNTVLAVFQKGYQLSDRVIRPARVVVSKK